MALTKVKLIADGTIVQSNLHTSHGITTADIGENASYLYYTDARARAAISVSGNALSYNSSTGVITSNFEESPTFTGDVTITGGDLTLGTDSIASNINSIGDVLIFNVDSNANTGGSPNMQFKVSGTTELTLNSTTATFAGDVHAGGATAARFKSDGTNTIVDAIPGSSSIIFRNSGAVEKMRLDSSGNLGIGTTTPEEKLHVVGDQLIYGNLYLESTSGSYRQIAMNTTDGADNQSLYLCGGGTASGVRGGQVIVKGNEVSSEGGSIQIQAGRVSTGDIIFKTGVTVGERMRIDEAGNVGIGGNNSSYKLISIGDYYPIAWQRSGGTIGTLYSDSTSVGIGVSNLNNAGIFFTSAQHIDFRVNGGTKMFLNSSGNLGIGTTSPGHKLDVAGSGRFQPGIADGDALVTIAQTNSNAYVHAGLKINAGNTNPFYIYQSGSSNTLRFNYNSLSDAGGQMVITDAGNVGIGTSSPSEILHTNKNSAGNIVGGYFTNSQANTGAEQVSLAFGLNRSGGDFVRQVKAITFGAEQQWTGTPSTVDGFLSFSTVEAETVAERMRIHSNGRVSIGSSTASANTLTLAGSAVEFDIHNTSGKRWRLNADTSGNLLFEDKTGGTEVMRLATSGYVGIGTTSPSERLTVDGNLKVLKGDDARIYINDVGDSSTILLRSDGSNTSIGTDSNHDLQIHANGSEKMRIKSNASPQIRIGDGDNEQLAAIRLGGENAGGGRLYFEYNGDDSYIDSYGGHGSTQRYRDLTIGARNLKLLTGNTSGGTRMYINVNGQVGIGTTSPSATLHVATAGGIKLFNDSTYGYISIGSSGLTGQYPYLRVDSFRSDGSGYFWAFGHETPGGVKSIKMLINDSGNDEVTIIRSLAISTFASNEFNGSYPSFSTGVLIRSNDYSYFNGGNIGIGQTSPNAKLDIRGCVAMGPAIYDGNLSRSTTGWSQQDGGSLHINWGLGGTASSGDTITFTYGATSWKSWSLKYNFASTNGICQGVVGGYWNNSGSHSNDTQIDNLGVSVAVTHSGQNNIITFTFTALGTHPMANFVYMQSGGDGQPRMDRVTLNAVT